MKFVAKANVNLINKTGIFSNKIIFQELKVEKLVTIMKTLQC